MKINFELVFYKEASLEQLVVIKVEGAERRVRSRALANCRQSQELAISSSN
jgi:hypothetical protein